SSDQDTFPPGAQHGSVETAAFKRRDFDLSAHIAVAADRAQQHVARRADVRFANTPNILQPTSSRIVWTLSGHRKARLPAARSAPASNRARQLLGRSG